MAYFDENSCGSRSFYNAPVVIDELPDNRIGIFPNPGTGIFNIRFGDELLNQEGILEVYNVSGQMILRRNPAVLQNEEIIDLSGNTPGIYMITLRTSNDVFNAKIVIQ
jgi:hypothetical protein